MTSPRNNTVRHYILALLLLPAVLALPGCAALGLDGINVISVDEEWAMGEQLEQELNQELPLSDDQEVLDYVRRIGQLLVEQTELADREWRFHVVDTADVNAFNAPGGLVYVFSGLIEEAGDAAEFVAVMAHEVAHGVARHGSELLSRQYGLALLAEAVLGEDPGLIQQIATEIMAAGAIARFSREMEFEADEIGVRLSADAGYHPRGMAAFLRRLQALQERDPGTVEEFFATHPAVAERIERVEAQVGELDEVDALTTADEEFRAIQERL